MLQDISDSLCVKTLHMLLMSQGAPGCRVVHVGQAEHKEPPEGAHIDIQLRPGGGLEGVDALPPASEDTVWTSGTGTWAGLWPAQPAKMQSSTPRYLGPSAQHPELLLHNHEYIVLCRNSTHSYFTKCEGNCRHDAHLGARKSILT